MGPDWNTVEDNCFIDNRLLLEFLKKKMSLVKFSIDSFRNDPKVISLPLPL